MLMDRTVVQERPCQTLIGLMSSTGPAPGARTMVKQHQAALTSVVSKKRISNLGEHLGVYVDRP